MFQDFRADDGIVVTSVRSGVKRITAKEQLRKPSTIRCVAHGYRAEVEAAIGDAALSQDHFRQEAIATPDFEYEAATTILNVLQNFLEEWVV
jgi:hypothetical protein